MRDLYWWEWLLIGIAIVYALFIILYMRNLVQNKLKFLIDNCDESQVEEKWRPFVRTDRKKWSLCEIYFCAVFLLPIRIILLLLTAIFISIISCFCSCQKKGVDNTHVEQSACKRTLFSIILRITIRFAMICLGVWWIPKKMRKVADFDEDYPQDRYKGRNDKTTIIVGNHIGYIEAVYFATTKYCPSFVAKKAVSKLPFLGGLGKTMQCIFVERSDNLARNQVLESIEKRCKLIKEGKRFPPLAMFPEGTCSNGNYILSFKKGAFEPFSPIKVFYFKFFDRHFNNYFDSLPIGTHLLITMCQLYNKFEVNEFDTYYPDHLNLKNPEDWTTYANKIKNIMIKCGNIKWSSSGYRDCQAYEQYLKQKKIKIQQRSMSDQLHRNFSRGMTIADRDDAIQEEIHLDNENLKEIEENQENQLQKQEDQDDKQNQKQEKNKDLKQIDLKVQDQNQNRQECDVGSLENIQTKKVESNNYKTNTKN